MKRTALWGEMRILSSQCQGLLPGAIGRFENEIPACVEPVSLPLSNGAAASDTFGSWTNLASFWLLYINQSYAREIGKKWSRSFCSYIVSASLSENYSWLCSFANNWQIKSVNEAVLQITNFGTISLCKLNSVICTCCIDNSEASAPSYPESSLWVCFFFFIMFFFKVFLMKTYNW